MSFKIFEEIGNEELMDSKNVEYVDLSKDMLSIENMFNVLDESIITLNDLDTSISMESLIPKELRDDKHMVMLSVEHINTLRTNIGLSKSVNVSSVNTIDLSIEEKMSLFKKIIIGIKKMYLKIVAAVKKFVVKIINNGKVLDERLEELKHTINKDSKATTIDVKENLKLKNYFATILDTYMSLGLKDTKVIIDHALSVIETYKSTAEITEAVTVYTRDEKNMKDGPLDFPSKIISDINKREKIEEAFRNKALQSLIISYSTRNENSGIDPKGKNNGVIIRADGGTLEGLIEVPTDDGIGEYVLYKTKKTVKSGGDDSITSLTPKDMLDIINKIGTPSKHMNELSSVGDDDVKAGDMLVKVSEKFADNSDGAYNDLSKIISMSLNLIPKVYNANIIGYYNTVNNIIKTLEIHNKYQKIKRI